MADVEALTIGPNCEVTMYFSLSLTDGTVADSTEVGEPMTFTMGDGSLIEGLELALYGLKIGDKQQLAIEARDAFGFPDEENVHTLPKSDFAPSLPLESGIILSFETPAGDEIPGTIREVGTDGVVVDFNHPLAGHELIFDVEIVDIKLAQTDESEAEQ